MELLEHDAKRKVELELMQLREDLEEAGVYTEEQIEDKVGEAFDRNLQESKKLERMRAREDAEQA